MTVLCAINTSTIVCWYEDSDLLLYCLLVIWRLANYMLWKVYIKQTSSRRYGAPLEGLVSHAGHVLEPSTNWIIAIEKFCCGIITMDSYILHWLIILVASYVVKALPFDEKIDIVRFLHIDCGLW